MKRTLIFMSALLMASAVSAADVKSLGSSTDKKWTASSSDGCANGSTITLDGLVVTLGNSDDTGNSWSWHENNGGLIPTQMPSTDGTASTLITTFSEKSPYGTLPTEGCYLVLKPSKSQAVTIQGKDGGNDQNYVLAEVSDESVVAADVQEPGTYHSYYVEANKTYYFFENASAGHLTNYRFTLKSISVDPTDLIANPDFSANTFSSSNSSDAPQGWTLTSSVYTTKISTVEKGSGTIAKDQNHWQIWDDYKKDNNGTVAKAYQKVGNLAPGIYTIGVTLVADFPGGRVKLYGNNNSKAVVSGKYGQYTVDAAVTDGTLTLGLDIATTAGTTDLEIDDFTLTYKQPLSNNYNGEVYLSELDTEAPTAIDNVNVTLGRTLTADQWNTLAVPFAITDISSLGTVKELKSADGNTLTFGDATTIEAGKPYLVKPSATLANPTFNGVSITATEGTSQEAGDYKFVGRLFKSDLATDGTIAYFTSSGEVKKLTSGNINGLRAYILQPKETSNVKAFFLGEETTGINGLKLQNRDHDVYDLSGRRVNAASMHNGIYIIEGKKYVVK